MGHQTVDNGYPSVVRRAASGWQSEPSAAGLMPVDIRLVGKDGKCSS